MYVIIKLRKLLNHDKIHITVYVNKTRKFRLNIYLSSNVRWNMCVSTKWFVYVFVKVGPMEIKRVSKSL